MRKILSSSINVRLLILYLLGLIFFVYEGVKKCTFPLEETVYDSYIYILDSESVYPAYVLDSNRKVNIHNYKAFYKDTLNRFNNRPDFRGTFVEINTQAIVIDRKNTNDILEIEYVDVRLRRRQGFVLREFIHDSIAPINEKLKFNITHLR